MHQQIDKKTKFFFYSLIIIILTSVNNYNFNKESVFNIKDIQVKGFSKKMSRLRTISKKLLQKYFFINNDYFLKLSERNDVKYLIVKKNYPNKIIIDFIPAKPICIIEINNNKIVLGDNGKKLDLENKEDNLPTVTGSGDIDKIYSVVNLLYDSKLDYKLIKKINFFKSGRFDIHLQKGTIIKLPIKFTKDIINYSSNLLNEKKFVDSKIIDLRIKNKIIKYE